MNVSGVLLRARPERFPEVMTMLAGIPGVEVHASDRVQGRIIVTVEDGPGHSVEDSLLEVHLMDGISDAALVYQYSDEGLNETKEGQT
ncbi:MAG: chaperone NapD [Sulfuritalea sp.]|jgi:nitrate reductase NapD|nr:chaperone NapD [Sulfuritalea sp.]